MKGQKTASGKTISSCGVDWLTVTTTREDVGALWWEMLTKDARQKGGLDGQITEWGNQWYVGAKAQGWKWGYSQSNAGYITVLSGEMANSMYHRFMVHHSRATRVDSQVTVRLKQAEPDFIERAYNYLESGNLKRAAKCAKIVNNQGGETLYIGSRQSENFGRLYDKGVEQGSEEKGVMYRYEVERKGQSARRMADTIACEHSGNVRAKFLVSDVHKWFDIRGCPLLFDKTKTDLVIEQGHRVETSVDRKLEWLRTQVRPTVSKLSELGYEQQLREALGLEIWEEYLSKKA